jgi:hypothetical protein
VYSRANREDVRHLNAASTAPIIGVQDRGGDGVYGAKVEVDRAEEEVDIEILRGVEGPDAGKVGLGVRDSGVVEEAQGQDKADRVDETVQERHHDEEDVDSAVGEIAQVKDEDLRLYVEVD